MTLDNFLDGLKEKAEHNDDCMHLMPCTPGCMRQAVTALVDVARASIARRDAHPLDIGLANERLREAFNRLAKLAEVKR